MQGDKILRLQKIINEIDAYSGDGNGPRRILTYSICC